MSRVSGSKRGPVSDNPLTPKRLEEIRARLEAASPGPWASVCRTGFAGWLIHVSARDRIVCELPPESDSHQDALQREANAALIAHAPADLRALLDDHARQAAEIERLRAENQALKKVERQRWGNAREGLGLDARNERGA